MTNKEIDELDARNECPVCGSDLIHNIGDTFQCNNCDATWEMKDDK